jgi:hypothetical protein
MQLQYYLFAQAAGTLLLAYHPEDKPSCAEREKEGRNSQNDLGKTLQWSHRATWCAIVRTETNKKLGNRWPPKLAKWHDLCRAQVDTARPRREEEELARREDVDGAVGGGGVVNELVDEQGLLVVIGRGAPVHPAALARMARQQSETL